MYFGANTCQSIGYHQPSQITEPLQTQLERKNKIGRIAWV